MAVPKLSFPTDPPPPPFPLPSKRAGRPPLDGQKQQRLSVGLTPKMLDLLDRLITEHSGDFPSRAAVIRSGVTMILETYGYLD